MNIGELMRLYRNAESCDQELAAEQRSNIRLTMGLHYQKRTSAFWKSLREAENISKQQKLRLTKNHIHRIVRYWTNAVLSRCANALILPANESEIQDQKSAQLHSSVWQYKQKELEINKLRRRLVSDYVQVGEVICKMFHNPSGGKMIGNEITVDEATGEMTSTPKFSGQLIIERIFGFDFFRDPDALTFETSSFVGFKKMVETKVLQDQFKDEPEKQKMINSTSDRTHKVFDGQSGSYTDTKGLTKVVEMYFRSSDKYPKGHYYIFTEAGILYEGELPEDPTSGELLPFPIYYVGFDEAATSPRSFSIIKQVRPCQAEVNRCASKIAEHQTSIGDDKLLTTAGASLSPGATAHGVKHLKINGGGDVKILPGRDGGQFVPWMDKNISEMYQIAEVPSQIADVNTQTDAYALLFRSLKERQNYSLYADKFSEFFIDLVKGILILTKAYAHESEIIPIIGKHERVNIAEYKSMDNFSYQVKIEQTAEDLESQMGKQLTLQHYLQYVGSNLDPQDSGKILRSMPFLNDEELFSDLTLDYDNAKNDLLALDRGEPVGADPTDNHTYIIKKLTHRMKQSDFRYLNPQIQQNYQAKRAAHEQMFAEQQQAIQAAASGFVPSGGQFVGVDLHRNVPGKPGMTRRIKLPSEAIQWLITKLEQQGSSLEQLNQLDPSSVQQMVAAGQLGPMQDAMGQPPLPGQFQQNPQMGGFNY